MPSWHNRFGENGQRLTILSLLARADPDASDPAPGGDLSLDQALQALYRIAGEDAAAGVLLSVTIRGDEGAEFTSQENVPLRELATQLYATFGPEGKAPTVLRVLGPDDDPFDVGAAPDAEVAEETSDAGPVRATVDSALDTAHDTADAALSPLRRLREAVHQLFGGSAEEGIPPTVLSLLVAPEDRNGGSVRADA